MSEFKIFIAEDDKWYSQILQYHLSLNMDYEVCVYGTGGDLLSALDKNPDIVTIDYSLPDMNGEELLGKILQENPNVPVIAISGQEDVSTAINLLRKGAYDYIVKNEETKERLWNTILNIKDHLEVKQEVVQLKEKIERRNHTQELIRGNSKGIKKVHALIEKGAKTNINISITGETGTGKELVALAIHEGSKRNKNPFVPINVASIPSELMESELFGHEKGAFTGAVNQRIGKFELANDGVLFLDEIGEMDMQLQSKLLRVLQEKELTRVGGNESVKVNCRIVTATHKNLLEEVKKGAFRQDLYYRLIGLPIEVPPLRDREGDILLLAKYFIDDFCKENGIDKKLTKEAATKLSKYSFPGNVRELKAVIELGIVLSEGSSIEEDDINFQEIDNTSSLLYNEKTLREYEMEIVRLFLKKYNGNVVKVSEKLDIGKSTIYRMLKEAPEFFEN